MKEIFTDIFKKLTGFFQVQEKTEDASKDVACNRLKLVLMQDRTNLTPQLLERMRGEMIDLLSKYVEMDKEALELNFAQEGDSMALMLSIPVLRAKDEEEIQALIEAEGAAKAKAKEEAAEEAEDESEEDDEEDEAEEDEEICSCGCQSNEDESDNIDTCECESCPTDEDKDEADLEEKPSKKKK